MKLESRSQKVTIYTDGSCWPNPGGKGGWAWSINKNIYDSGRFKNTTNNQMELAAVIHAIQYAKKAGYKKMLIYSDSKYCVNGFTTWMYRWQKRNWKNGRLKNIPYWKRLWEIKEGVTLKWVKGHNGNEMNEFVDNLASLERRGVWK